MYDDLEWAFASGPHLCLWRSLPEMGGIIEGVQEQQCLVVTPQGGMCLLLDIAQVWNSVDWRAAE